MSDSTPVVSFNYRSAKFRATKEEGGDPWFVTKDACGFLGYVNPRETSKTLDEDERGVRKIDTPGGPQEMAVISESGLYTLIIRSNKPEAKPFRRWVTHEVLPALRKAGTYTVPGASKLGSFGSPKKLEDVVAASRELTAISKSFKSSMDLVRTMGLAGYRAIKMANEMTLGRTGCDCIDLLDVDDYLREKDAVKLPSAEWGFSLVNRLLCCMVSLGSANGKRQTVSVEEALSDSSVGGEFKGDVEVYGIKRSLNGIFFHPATVERRLLPQLGEGWSGYNIRQYLLQIPGAEQIQLRLKGSAVRGVVVPWAEGGAA